MKELREIATRVSCNVITDLSNLHQSMFKVLAGKIGREPYKKQVQTI